MNTTEKLPILKGILNGVVQYHNAPVRFGRVPKREKARILAAMQQSTNSRSQEKALTAELEDDQRLLNTVVRAHMDTCDFTSDKVGPMIAQARQRPSYTACPPSLACPLNPNPQPLTGQQELLQDFSKRFSPAIRGVVEFAKRITGFPLLPQDDQVTLLKAGVFEVLLVRLACMFDSETNSMICLNGQVLKRDSIQNSSNARFLMDSMFEFADRLNRLNLSDAEIALFSSIVVIAPNRPGLRNLELIDKMHNKLKALLENVLSQNHPENRDLCSELIAKIPDLRTLNTLHSEKLLAFKMTEQQLQLQQQQQQQQQHNLWNDLKYKTEVDIKSEDMDGKSPIGSSSWSSASDAAAMDEVKSPMGSVSSTESMCSGEVASLSETTSPHHHLNHHHHHHLHQHHAPLSSLASNAPLLAATLAGGVCPARNRANSGGSDDDIHHNHLLHPFQHNHHLHMHLNGNNNNNAMQINGGGIISSNGINNNKPASVHRIFRKLDSPGDSGIESGTEKIEKISNSTPTSVCSSPRSSSEEKDEHHHQNGHHHFNHHISQQQPHHHHQQHPVIIRTISPSQLVDQSSSSNTANGYHRQNGNTIEDMPVLKRVLQAPPLYDTNSLMDEAYKPHKKFRALRNKDTAEAEPLMFNSATVSTSNCGVAAAATTTAAANNNNGGTAFTTVGRVASGPPPAVAGLVIPNGHPSPILSATLTATASSSSSPNSATSSSSSSSPHLQYHLTSSLSSTHSTLARSLMEGPRMTPEQMKRTNYIHEYIMNGPSDCPSFHELTAATPSSMAATQNRCSPPYQHKQLQQQQQQHSYLSSHHQKQQQQQQQLWEQSIAPTSVITSSAIRSSPRIPSPYSYNANNGGSPIMAHGNSVIRSQPSSPSSTGSQQHQLHHHEQQQQRRSPSATLSAPPSIYIRSPNGSPSSVTACSSPLQHYNSAGGLVVTPAATSPGNNCFNGPTANAILLNSNFSNGHHYTIISSSAVGGASSSSSSSQQPLNLSKKTPPSSPRPLSANSVTAGPKIVPLEA